MGNGPQDLGDAETASLSRERDLKTIADLSPVGIYRTDAEGHITYVNDRWREIMDINDSGAYGTGWIEAMHPDDRNSTIGSWKAYVAGQSERYEIDCRVIRADGSITWVKSQTEGDFDDSGVFIGCVGTLTDVTDLKMTQLALAASEQRFSLAMEGSNDGLWDWDLVTNRVYYSPRWFEILGYESGELPSTPETWETLLHPEDRPQVEAFHQRCLASTQKSNEVEFRFRHKTGHDVDILARGFAVRGENGEPVRLIGTHSDNSARKAAEKDAVAAREKAEMASRAKSEFLSSMSHELRTPMNAILGYAQLLEVDQSGRLGEDQKSFVAEIMRSGFHMLELINDVLNLAKIEENDVPLDLQDQGPGTVISACLSMIEAVAEQSDIAIINRVPGEGLPLIRIDTLRFRQALLNLLSNGIKYNRPQGELIVDCGGGVDGLFRIRVSDTGEGIENGLQDRVFEPFDRLGAENSSTPGTGIGLSVSKQLIESMGGVIGFESTVGVGTTFWIDVPLSDPKKV